MSDPAIDPGSQLQKIFGQKTFVEALHLLDSGGVFDLHILQAGSVVTGVVNVGAGANSHATRHRVYLRQAGGIGGNGIDRKIDGECSCGAQGHCIHVAAVAIAASRHTGHIDKTGGTAPGSRRAPGETPQRNPLAFRSARPQRQQLCYLIEPRARADEHPTAAGALQLSLWVGEITDGGERVRADNACVFVPRFANGAGEWPRYVDATDRGILQILTAHRYESPWVFPGAPGAPSVVGEALLQQIVSTGRAFWHSLGGEPLRAGAARTALFEWETLPHGDQRLHCQSPLSIHLLAAGESAIYIDAIRAECGQVGLPYAVEVLRQYWHRADVPPEQVEALNEEMAHSAAAEHFPRLRALSIRRQALSSLQGKLVLSAGPETALHFVYNGVTIDSRWLSSGDSTVRRMDVSPGTDVLHEIDRDRAAERALQSHLERALSSARHDNQSWLTFMMQGLPALQAEGWEVEVRDDFPYRIVVTEKWYADLDTKRRDGWFDLRLGVVVDGHYADLLPALVTYLQATWDRSNTSCQRIGDHLLIRLDDGRYLPVAFDRIERIADTLVELHDRDSLDRRRGLSLPMSQVGRVVQLSLEQGAPMLRSEDQSLLQLLEELKDFRGIQPLAAPTHFQATLRPYQEEGLGWLQFLRRYRLGGILADDMGLGKTVQTLAHLWLEKTAGRLNRPALIVSPVSVIGNWQQEARRFAPQLRVLVLHGSRRREQFALIRTVDVVITGYALLQLDGEFLQQHEFSFLILDEAQTIKNPRAKVSQAARALTAEHRLCLTGTPMENHLGELWSLLDFLQPGFLGTQQHFQRHYRDPIEKNGNAKRAASLARRIAPVMLRRTKDAVARDLPAKTQIVETIVLDERQRDFYDGIRLTMHRRVQEVIQQQGLARSQITVLDALLKLRQACCDPRLVEDSAEARAIPSAKLDWLRTVLPELVAEGRRVLLFSQFTSMLRLIEAAVAELGIAYYLLTGETQQRAELVDRFQAGGAPLFLISLKAGGTGLNLTAADTVIHYDPWWNPAAEAQATDRAHRIGQNQPVFVYKLIAQGTVEEKIMQLQADKHALANQLYTPKNAMPTQLSAADLEDLFAP